MGISRERIESFFADYELKINRALIDVPYIDKEATADVFADCFIEVTPRSVVCGRNDTEFMDKIPSGFEFYRNIGTRSMQICDLQVTDINDTHSMVKICWKAHYKRKDNSELDIEFDVIYFVKDLNGELKIFCHITGDEERIYKEKGIAG